MSEDQKPELVEIKDLNQFVFFLNQWHANKVQTIRHLMTIPVGTEMEIDNEPYILDEQTHRGFVAGLTVALSELGELPFAAEMDEPDPATPDEPTQTH